MLLPLDDSVEIYPAHGAGSSCGKAMSAKTGSTIGFERRFNPAFRYDDRHAFVDFIMAGIPAKPAAFDKIVAKNRGLVPLVAAKPRPFAAREAWEAIERGACVVDLRDVNAYGEGHVAGALNVWIDSPQFAERVAGMVPAGAPLLLMGAPSDFDRAVIALSRVGVDEVAGFLQWGMVEWRSEALPSETVPQITAHDLADWLEQGRDVPVIDVREPAEWDEGHIASAISLPMFEAVARRAEVPTGRTCAVVCAGGLRSSAVIGALKRQGLGPFVNVTGGMAAWVKAGYSVTRETAPRRRHGPADGDGRSGQRGGLPRAVVPVAEHEAREGDRRRAAGRTAGGARHRSGRPRRPRRLHAAQRAHDRRAVRVARGYSASSCSARVDPALMRPAFVRAVRRGLRPPVARVGRGRPGRHRQRLPLRLRSPVDRLRRAAQLGRLGAHRPRPRPIVPTSSRPWLYSGSLLNLGVLFGGLTAALLSREFAIRVPPRGELVKGAGGGPADGRGRDARVRLQRRRLLLGDERA